MALNDLFGGNQRPQQSNASAAQSPNQVDPEQHAALQHHPAVVLIRQLQDEWRRTGVKDPRIDAYMNAHATALSQNMEPSQAVIFAASAATGRF